MDPIPETRDVLYRLRQTDHDPRVLEGLARLTDTVRTLVPSCIGVSIGMVDSGLTLAFVSSSSELAALDAVHYLAESQPDELGTNLSAAPLSDDPTDEESWRVLGLAENSVDGIESSLTIPLLETDESVLGWVNFYATAPHAFDLEIGRLAELCGAWAPGAVANADLTFSSRLRAAAGPAILDDQERVDQATGITSEVLGISPDEARRRIRSAAARAGVAESHLARTLINSQRR